MVFIFVVLFSLIFEIGAIFLEVQLKQTILSHYLNYVYDLETFNIGKTATPHYLLFI